MIQPSHPHMTTGKTIAWLDGLLLAISHLFNMLSRLVIAFLHHLQWLLVFLPAILIPVCASSSPAFHMMYSAYMLNKQGDNIQSWLTPFPIYQSVVPCTVLTVAPWHAYRFLRRQIRWSGSSLRIFHSLLWSTVKGFLTYPNNIPFSQLNNSLKKQLY